MKRYFGGQMVHGGKYYNAVSGRLVELDSDGRLPGGPDDTYRRVNAAIMIVMAPLATLLFVLLLPVAYVASFATLWGYKLIRLMLGLGSPPVLRHH